MIHASVLTLLLSQALSPHSDAWCWPVCALNASTVAPQFAAAPSSGAGLPVSQNICTAVSSSLIGTSFCTDGSGATASNGSITVGTSQGAPSLVTQNVCPNGKNCDAKSVFRGATSGFTESANVDRSASITTTAGSFTACTEFIFALSATEQELASLSTSAVAGNYKYMFAVIAGGNTFNVYISTGACGGTGTIISTTQTLVNGGHYLGCVTWSATDGFYRTYLNGIADTVSGANATICGGGANSRFAVGGFWNGALTASPLLGATMGAFHLSGTTGQLSAGAISTLSNAILGFGATGSNGEALAWGRTAASNRGCFRADGYGSQISTVNVPCVAQGMFGKHSAYTIDAIRNEDLSNAAWTNTATVTANAGVTPWGVKTAAQLSDVSGAASQGSSQLIVTGSLTKHTMQAFITPGTIAKATCSMVGAANSAGDCTVSNAAIGALGAELTCTSPVAYGAGLTGVTISCVVGTVVGDTGTIFVSYLDHAVSIDGHFPHAPTIAAAYTMGGETTAAFTLGTPIPVAAGSLASSFLLTSTPAGNSGLIGAHNNGVGTFDVMAHANVGTWDLYVAGGVKTGTLTIPLNTLSRASLFWGTTTNLSVSTGTPTVLTGTAATAANTLDRVTIGSYVGGNSANGFFSACADPNPVRCHQ